MKYVQYHDLNNIYFRKIRSQLILRNIANQFFNFTDLSKVKWFHCKSLFQSPVSVQSAYRTGCVEATCITSLHYQQYSMQDFITNI